MQLLTTTQSYIRNSNVLELRMFLYRGSRGVRFTDDNICISIAQYYELNGQQNLWCEILEFWAFRDNKLIHSVLCGFQEKCYEIRLANEPFFAVIEPLLHSNTATVVIQ